MRAPMAGEGWWRGAQEGLVKMDFGSGGAGVAAELIWWRENKGEMAAATGQTP